MKRKPLGVLIIGILLIILAAVDLLTVIMLPKEPLSIPVLIKWILSPFYIIVGVSFLQFKSWARRTYSIVAGVGAVIVFLHVTQTKEALAAVFVNCSLLAFFVLSLFYVTRFKIKKQFK